MKKVS